MKVLNFVLLWTSEFYRNNILVSRIFQRKERKKTTRKEERKKGNGLFVSVSLCVYLILFYYNYGWKHRPFEALNAILFLHPLASASCCCGIVTVTVITTIPSNASAATIAITA